MKKITLRLLVLLAGFAAAAGMASSDSKQWQVSNPKKVQFETEGKTVRLENTSKVWQVLELEPKTRYELTFSIKGENIQDGENRGARIVLISGKKHVRITSLFRNEPETGTFDWRKGFGIIDTAVFPDSKIRLELNLFGNGTVWFKDVQIKKQIPDTKGDFSNALKIDNKLSRWNFSPAKNVMPDSQIKIGEQSIRMNGPSRVWQVLEFEPDTQYELTFSVKGQNIQSNKNSGARIVLNDGKHWERFTSIPKPETGTFDWRTGRAVFDTGRFKSTRISFELHLIGNGTVWYDELKIVKIPKNTKSSGQTKSVSFHRAYGNSIKNAVLVPQGVFGFFEPNEPVKLRLLIDGKEKNYEYSLLVKDDTGKTIIKQGKKTLTDEIVLPGQPCGYYSAESDIYADGKKAYTIQTGFAVSPVPGKRDPFFGFGYGVVPELHDGYKRIGCGSITLKLTWYTTNLKDTYPSIDNRLKLFKPYLESGDFHLKAALLTCLTRKTRSPEQLQAGYPLLYDQRIEQYLDAISYMHPKVKKVKTWSIGQETPSSARMKNKFAGTWSESMTHFVTLVRMGSRRLKKLDPEIKIYAGGNNDIEKISDVEPIEMGDIIEDFDVYYIDAYTGNWDLAKGGVKIPEADLMNFYQKSSALSIQLGKGQYIANEETGYSIPYGTPFDGRLAFTQARLTARSLIISKAAPVIYYELHQPNIHAVNLVPPNDSTRHMATVWKTIPFGKQFHRIPLPGGAMYATAAAQLAFAQFKADIISGNIYSYIFTKPDGSTLVTLWNIEKEQPFPAELPADTKILNMYGRDITGKPLVIGPNPVYISIRQGAAEVAKFLKEAIYRNSPEMVCTALPGTVFVRSLIREARDAKIQIPGTDPVKVKILPGRINTFKLPATAPGKLVVGTRQYDIPLEKNQQHKLKRVSGLAELRKGKPGLLHYPDHIRPLEALHPERCYFRSEFNPKGHNVSAKYWTGYDDRNFYMAVEVDDPIHLQRHTGIKIRHDDCFQFVLSPDDYPPSSMLSLGEAKPSSEYKFGLALTPKGVQLVKLLGNDEGIKNYPANVFRNGNLTCYEVAIPWTAVGGKAKRFGFLIWDNNEPVNKAAPYRLEFCPGIVYGAVDSSKLAELVYE